MKPFDLEAAKRGEPLITRDGHKAHFIGVRSSEWRCEQPIVAETGRCGVSNYTTKGHYYSDEEDSPFDLFMAPRKEVRWLVVWRSPEGSAGSTLCSSQKSCESAADALKKEGFTILTSGQKVEWEE